MNKKLKAIMKREKVFAGPLAEKCGVSAVSFRRMLRGEVKMDVDVFETAMDALGYKILISKKEDLQ